MTKSEFKIYDKQNPKIWLKLEKLAIEFIETQLDKGIPIKAIKTSVWNILNVIRWHESMARNNYGSFKINNNSFSFYARKFQKTHPRFKDVFEIRSRKL